MDLSNKTTHQIEYSARINENELYNLIAEYVAKKSEIELLSSDKVRIYLSQEDKGCMGFKYVADVSIKRDL